MIILRELHKITFNYYLSVFYGMEFIETLILLGGLFVGVSFLIFIYKFLPNIKQKSTKNIVEKTIGQENLKVAIKDMQENYGIQIVQLKKDRNRLQGIINRNQMNVKVDEDDESESDEINWDEYVIDKEMVRPMLANWGMNADALDNPLLQGMIKDKFKGNEELMITLGILKPKTNSSEQTSSSSEMPTDTITNWA